MQMKLNIMKLKLGFKHLLHYPGRKGIGPRLWRSGLSARVPECQKLKMVG